MDRPPGNPRPREGINAPGTSGLGEFATLVLGLGIIVVALTAALALAAGWLAPLIPYRWEETVAGEFDPRAEPAYPRAEAELQRLVDALGRSTDLPRGMEPRVHLIDSAQPNAFATLGGHIVVTSGLVESVSSENGLAMVLAHELAHVENRHPIQALGRGALVNLVWAMLVGSTGQSAIHDILGGAGLLTMLSFNRGMEREADRDALVALRAHYGHAGGAGEFFRELLEHRDEPGWTTLFRTHPRTAERLEAVVSAAGSADRAELEPLPPALRGLHEEGA